MLEELFFEAPLYQDSRAVWQDLNTGAYFSDLRRAF